MIEMRWYVPVTGEKVLQYRQQSEITTYKGPGAFPEIAKNMQWGPWKDVPMESEHDPSCP